MSPIQAGEARGGQSGSQSRRATGARRVTAASEHKARTSKGGRPDSSVPSSKRSIALTWSCSDHPTPHFVGHTWSSPTPSAVARPRHTPLCPRPPQPPPLRRFSTSQPFSSLAGHADDRRSVDVLSRVANAPLILSQTVSSDFSDPFLVHLWESSEAQVHQAYLAIGVLDWPLHYSVSYLHS